MRRSIAALACMAVVAIGCASESSSVASDTPVSVRIAYGDDRVQFGALTVPAGEGPFPVVVFVHGGFWRREFGLDLAEAQVASAVAAGYATWNIEYRRVGHDGGGYPGTLADVDAAIEHLASLADKYAIDTERVAVVGHSAGGHLALWLGQRSALPAGAVGADPSVVPVLVVGQAPVADLVGNVDLGGGAVVGFMGAAPEDDPAAYAIADPAQLLPVDVPQLIVQGADDRIVPADRAEAYAELVADAASLAVEVVPGEDHFDVIAADSTSWRIVLERVSEAFA